MNIHCCVLSAVFQSYFRLFSLAYGSDPYRDSAPWIPLRDFCSQTHCFVLHNRFLDTPLKKVSTFNRDLGLGPPLTTT